MLLDGRVDVSVSDGINVRLGLSASEILSLADFIISTSTSVHDAVAAVPLDQVNPHSTAFISWWFNLKFIYVTG